MKLLFVIFMISTSSFAKSVGTHVLFERNGVVEYGSIATEKVFADQTVIVDLSKYSTNIPKTSLLYGAQTNKAYRIPVAELIEEVSSISAKISGQETSLKKESIVVDKHGTFFMVESVFPDGRVALSRMETSLNHRDRIAGLFVNSKENVIIATANDIAGVLQPCYKEYCAQKNYEKIGQIEFCPKDYSELQVQSPEYKKSVEFGCRKQNGSVRLNAVFSNGTMVVGNKIIHPFLDSTNDESGTGTATP